MRVCRSSIGEALGEGEGGAGGSGQGKRLPHLEGAVDRGLDVFATDEVGEEEILRVEGAKRV